MPERPADEKAADDPPLGAAWPAHRPRRCVARQPHGTTWERRSGGPVKLAHDRRSCRVLVQSGRPRWGHGLEVITVPYPGGERVTQLRVPGRREDARCWCGETVDSSP